jgi:hypothetical protein
VATESIDPSAVHFPNSMSILDPMGRVFLHDGRVFRGVWPERVPFVRRLLDSGLLEQLADERLSVRTWATERTLEPFGLVLEHEPLEFLPQVHWPYGTYLRAATGYLRLMRRLAAHGLTLHDGHGGNFGLAPDAHPVWCDVGSIVPKETGALYGLEEWFSSFYYPLKLIQRAGLSVVRRMLLICTRQEYYRLIGPNAYRLADDLRDRLPDSVVARALGKALDFRGYEYFYGSGPGERLSQLRRKLAGQPLDYGELEQFMDRLEAELEGLPLPWRRTPWGDYAGVELADGVPRSPRAQAVDRVLQELKPPRVLDVGANVGVFAHVAARSAEVVYAMDTDESAASQLSDHLARAGEPRRIYPTVFDPTALALGSSGFDRYRSHTVLALAVTHHMSLTQRRSFAHIAARLALLTERCLLVEFMPRGLSTGDDDAPTPPGYTLEAFLDALRVEFDRVEVDRSCPVDPQHPRILIRCERSP